MRLITDNRAFWCRLWAVAGPLFGIAWLWVPILDWANGDVAAWEIPVVAAGVAAFGALFLYATIALRRDPIKPVLGMLAIAIGLTLGVHDSFAWLFVWGGSAAAVRLDGPASATAVAAITALAAGTLALTSPEAIAFWGITATVFATSALWMLIGGLMHANEELREARAALAEQAVADERLRFARDLHDLLGHDLSLIALKAELAGKLLPDRVDAAADEVGQIRDLTRSALAQVREAVDGYRRPRLGNELAGARVAFEAAGIDLSVDDGEEPLDPEVESVLAWAVREGATNAIRHSGARHAAIRVRPGLIEISDDGRGAPGARPGGNGLTGLRERVQAVGGTLEAGAGPTGGFRLTVRVPAA